MASSHSVTSSARNRNDSGIVRPSALAVFRLWECQSVGPCSIGYKNYRVGSLAWISKRLRRCRMRARPQRGLGSERDGCLASWQYAPTAGYAPAVIEGRDNPMSALRQPEGQPIPALFKLAQLKIGDARQGDCPIGDNFYGCHCWFPNEWRRKRR